MTLPHSISHVCSSRSHTPPPPRLFLRDFICSWSRAGCFRPQRNRVFEISGASVTASTSTAHSPAQVLAAVGALT